MDRKHGGQLLGHEALDRTRHDAARHGGRFSQLTVTTDGENTHMQNPELIGPVIVIASGLIVSAVAWLFGDITE